MSLIERIAITALSAIDDALARRYSAPTQDIAVPGPWTDRDNDVLGVTVTPEVLAYIIQRRNRGELRQWCDLADHARRTNPHLHSQLQVRELSVQETDFEVVPGDAEGCDVQANSGDHAGSEAKPGVGTRFEVSWPSL